VEQNPPLLLPDDAESETVALSLDTLWRLSAEEAAKTDGLERKAAALASLAGLVVAVNGAFGMNVARSEGGWLLALFVLSYPLLIAAVAFAALAVQPAAHKVFGASELARLERPESTRDKPSAARLRIIAGLIERIGEERAVVERKKTRVEVAFALFMCGLVVVAIDASALAAKLSS
jgi:hypothetical protein